MTEEEQDGSVESDHGRRKESGRRTIWLWVMVVSVFGILLPPAVGLFGTMTAMVEAFESTRDAGQSDPEILSRSISNSLATTAAGIAISVGFLALFAFSLVGWIASGRVTRPSEKS